MINQEELNKIKNFKGTAIKRDLLALFLRKKIFFEKTLKNIDVLWVENEDPEELSKIILKLSKKDQIFIDNKWKDIYYKKRSIGCTLCTLWKWCTVVLSYKCNRDCFFCYEETPLNPKTQIDPYDKKDLDNIYSLIDHSYSDSSNKTLAITWWEPFLFTDKVYEILEYVNTNYPWKNKRIYTTWDLLSEKILINLKKLWLDELRFSIKPWEQPNLELYSLAKKYIPSILIEMPVMPWTKEYLIDILTKIDDQWVIDWINLNELTFNNINADKFKERGLKLDTYLDSRDLYHRYYDIKKIEIWVYWSKKLSLELIDYFSEKEAHFFIHYCDLNTVSHHHYLYKIKNAESLGINYSDITTFWLHKILRVYWNNTELEVLLNPGINYYSFDWYIELSVEYTWLFNTDKFSKIVIYKNYDFWYDVDFEFIK